MSIPEALLTLRQPNLSLVYPNPAFLHPSFGLGIVTESHFPLVYPNREPEQPGGHHSKRWPGGLFCWPVLCVLQHRARHGTPQAPCESKDSGDVRDTHRDTSFLLGIGQTAVPGHPQGWRGTPVSCSMVDQIIPVLLPRAGSPQSWCGAVPWGGCPPEPACPCPLGPELRIALGAAELRCH